MGMNTSMPGQEVVPSVFSPMTRTLDDLVYFTKSIIGMKPWTYDYTVHPLPWRNEELTAAAESKSLKVGLMMSDDVVPPSPAIARGVRLTADALTSAGHTVQPITFPDSASPIYGLRLASLLLTADGCATFKSFIRTGEPSDPGAAQLSFYSSLPRPLKYLYYLYVRYVKSDPLWAGLLRDLHPKSAAQNWQLVAQRKPSAPAGSTGGTSPTITSTSSSVLSTLPLLCLTVP